MKFLIPLAVAGIAIWLFSSKATSNNDEQSNSPQASIENVNDILEKAAPGSRSTAGPPPMDAGCGA